MFKKFKKRLSNLPKKIVAIVLVITIMASWAISIFSVKAQSYGNGDNFVSIDIENELGFTINNVTVNDYTWNERTDEFHTDDNQYHIVISITNNDDTFDIIPAIQYGGNWNEYITASTDYTEGVYTFVLDVNDSAHQGFIGLSVIENHDNSNEVGEGNSNFDGKAYVLWSCGEGTCYHYFDNIPSFDDGKSKFYKDTEVTADNDSSIIFDVDAEYKGWALESSFDFLVDTYKAFYDVDVVDWTNIDPSQIIGNPPDMREWEQKAIDSGACTREQVSQEDFENCVDEYVLANSNKLPYIKLQPLGEPTDNNAYVSYGDRNFKVVIYNDDFRGITMGDLSELNYYPSSWANPFIMQDQFDISGTTKNNPTLIDSVLLENTLIIRTLNYNSFNISSIKALDVPDDAIKITKDTEGNFKITFSSNFYDNVTFKATDTNSDVYYFHVKRYTIDGWIKYDNNIPVLTADFYFDRNKSYSDFEITAKIVYNDGSIKNVNLEPVYGVDDGMGNMTWDYESDEENPLYGPAGKGLKKSCFAFLLEENENANIDRIYLNAEYNGSTSESYAGAYAGSGEGQLANIYHGEGE